MLGLLPQVKKRGRPRKSSVLEPELRDWAAYVRMLYDVTGNWLEAEEAVAAGFAKALERLDQFDKNKDLRAWLRMVMVNGWRDSRKLAQAKAVSLDRPLPESAQFEGVQHWSEVLQGEDVPLDQHLLEAEEQQAVEKIFGQAMRALPHNVRGPLYWSVAKDKPYSWVAEKYRIPEGTVRSRVSRGLARLRRKMK